MSRGADSVWKAEADLLRNTSMKAAIVDWFAPNHQKTIEAIQMNGEGIVAVY